MYQSGVDELYHPLREESMSPQTMFMYQALEEETVSFENENENQLYRFPPASADFTTDQSPEELGDFLSRPTLIHTIAWVPAGVSDADIDPWTLFLSTTPIKNKIENFAFLRGDMHIKIVVNASPFYYGAMLINYTPTPTYVQPVDNAYTSALISQSQKPHIWIDLRTNMGGEMVLPFIYHSNYVRITSASAVATLGRLRNITYSGLQSANGATVNGVTVKIYAWMTDVTLTGNTTELALQAKKGIADEYGNGPVSRPATALANWASYLVNVPVIGTYAKATQIGASAVSSVAGLFGWSKVPVIENVKPVKPLFFHDLASAHLSEPISKMTLDPKAELSVDPRIVSSSTGEDELSISNLVTKDSYLTQTVWLNNDAPDTLLFNTAVNPTMHLRDTDTSRYIISGPPMAYCAELFSQWRGDIIYTFRIICSQYHRGRLRIHWDPITNTVTTDTSNQTLTKIVDLGEVTEVEFRVPYVQQRMWMNTRHMYDSIRHGITGLISPVDYYDNGRLTVRVLNNLSAPVDVASVTMMVFVRGAENLEFANPRDLSYFYTPFEPQTLVEDAEEDKANQSTPLNDRYLINYGEAIPSLRTLVQRSSLYDVRNFGAAYGQSTTDKLMQFTMRQCRSPAYPGYDQNHAYTAKGVVTPATTYYFNYCQYTPLAWITPMFVAKRGAIQWHYHLVDRANKCSHLRVSRSGTVISTHSTDLYGKVNSVVPSTIPSASTIAKTIRPLYISGPFGVAHTDTKVNPSLSVEMPSMTSARYNFTRPTLTLIGSSIDGSDVDTYTVQTDYMCDTTTDAHIMLHRYVNAGTDFSLNFFLCCPQIYFASGAGDTPV